MIRLAFATLLLFLAETVLAQSTILPVETGMTVAESQAWAVRVLQPHAEQSLRFTPFFENDLPAKTHLRIRYRSPVPVPVAAGLTGGRLQDLVRSVLPPAIRGDVLLPLTVSPSWRQNARGILLMVYWREGQEPAIEGIEARGEMNMLSQARTYLAQLLAGERVSSTSVMYLQGGRIAGVPLHIVVAVIALAFVILACIVLRGRRRLRYVGGILLAAFFLVHLQASLTRARLTAKEIDQWNANGTIGDLGYVYAAAEVLRAASADGKPMRVYACTQLVAPLRYRLHPIDVIRDPAQFANATHALVQGVWIDEVTAFSCDGKTRTGRILKRFPSGEAAVEFLPTDQ